MKNEKSLNVLVVEDNKLNAEVLSKFIKTNAKVDNIEVQTLQEVDRVTDEIKRNEVKPHMVILSEPSQGKIKFTSEIPARISQIKKVSPASQVVVLSTPNKMEAILETFRSGAFDVVVKDEHASKNVVNSIHRFLNSQDENTAFKKQRELATAH